MIHGEHVDTYDAHVAVEHTDGCVLSEGSGGDAEQQTQGEDGEQARHGLGLSALSAVSFKRALREEWQYIGRG